MSLTADILDMIRVKPGKKFRLRDHDPAWAGDLEVAKKERKAFAEKTFSEDITALAAAQDLLYAADTYSILLIFQAMDAAGKDSTIKHVMSGVNPQGCQVFSFKHPSAEELDHNFMWRYAKALPERGRIGIFNRSYYEEVLVVKVHKEILANQRIPDAKPGKEFWQARYEDINNFERHLRQNGTVILKFFLHLSKAEQCQRFLARLDDPTKHWKFSDSDLKERGFWDDYMDAYETCLNATSTEYAPWYVIPADKKWVSRALVAHIVTSAIERLGLKYPEVPEAKREQIKAAKQQLEAEA
ncbi:MAG: polyphosphate kinase 2 family protein [Planctomycetes bacterium]|nr:polyphosphate kinase 2 family protein [Planctomycetota bacterium]